MGQLGGAPSDELQAVVLAAAHEICAGRGRGQEPGLSIHPGGLVQSQTVGILNPSPGFDHADLMNRGEALYGHILVVCDLLDEDGEKLEPLAAGDGLAPLPGETRTFRIPFICDAARSARLRGWLPLPRTDGAL